MSYSSAGSDGNSYRGLLKQGGWVGRDWSLDLGSIAYNMTTVGQPYYTLVLNGQSFPLIGGEQEPGNPNQWNYRATNESFIRIRRLSNDNTYNGRGGFVGGVPKPRFKWQVWSKDGTLYEYNEDAWWDWTGCSYDFTHKIETYKWQLSRVVDTHGNVINYNYGRLSSAIPPC